MRNTSEDLQAIVTLLEKNFEMQAISVIYSAIDRLAWLDAQDEESGNKEFKGWLNKFFFNGESFDFNADDLWAARCGNIHTGAAESRAYRDKKARLVYYHVNTESIPNERLLALIEPVASRVGVSVENIRLVDHYWLAKRLGKAASRYEEYLGSIEIGKLKRVKAKAERQLSFQAIKWA